MLILAVDTSTQAGSLAVLRDDVLLGVLATHSEETYSSRMFRHLDFLLRDLGIELSQFDLYAVATGPGSFTGLRVGLTAVKGCAEVFNKPIAPVGTLEAIAYQASASKENALAIPILDARRGQIYGGVYCLANGLMIPKSDDRVETLGEFLEWLAPHVEAKQPIVVSPDKWILRELSEKRWQEPNAVFQEASALLAPEIARCAVKKASQQQLVDALTLEAHYVRRSDAELLWKGPQ